MKRVLVGWVPWFPLVLAGGFIAWLLAHFARVIDVIHLNPDAAWAPVLVRDLDSGTKGGLILVGEASHLTTIWFLNLTRTIPFSEVIWDWAPYLIFLAALGLTGWACRKVAGPWAAAMSFAAGATAEATVLLTVMAEGIRGNTFFADAVMGAFVVLVAVRPSLGRGWKIGLGAVVVMVAGSTLASDPLFLAVGLAPFVAAPIAVWILTRDKGVLKLGLAAGAMAVLAAGLDRLIWVWMRSLGFRKNYLTSGYSFATPGQMVENVKEFAGHVLVLGNGYSAGEPRAIVRAAQTAMAVVIVGAALYGFVLLIGRWRKKAAAVPKNIGLMLYTAFWLLSALGTLAAFALSTFPAGPSDSSRYVIPVVLALAAIGPLWGRRMDWRRPAAAVCVGLFCCLSIVSRGELFAYETTPGFQTLHEQGDEIVAFLQSENVKYGYGGYFTSHQLSLLSGLKVYSFPVIACRQPDSDTMCPFSVNNRTAWFEPREGERTFVIHDAMAPALIAPGPPAELGPPAVSKTFGQTTVSVFDFDITSTFAPPCFGSATFLCPE